jgi:hypothetical protein
MTDDLEARLLRVAQPPIADRVALLEAAVLGDADAIAAIIAARAKVFALARTVKAKATEVAARMAEARSAAVEEHAAMLTAEGNDATTQIASAKA